MEGATLLVDQAHRELERAILDDRIPPGTPLSVPKLAQQLGISRSPVREAVLRLIAAGLAANVPHKGAIVAEIAVADFADLFEVREPLEGVAARRACTNATPEDLDELRAILAEHERVVGGDDVDCQVELDMRFHRRIREIAANAELTASLDRIQMRSHHALNTLWRGRGTPRRSLDRHYEIFDAIEAGDGDAAEAAARIHIAEVRTRIIEALQPSDDGKVPA
jgi:DNA-binding GntR family transcriptional regulator